MTPRERRVLESLDERARRMELLSATLRGGGLSRERAATALASELHDLGREAADGGVDALAGAARALRLAIEHLGHLDALDEGARRDVLIVDDNEVTRDLIALSVEAQGHSVRAVGTLPEFLDRFRERRPDIILTEAPLPRAPVDQFCTFLRRTIGTDTVPIVVFSSENGPALERLAARMGADRYFCKDQGIDALVAGLNELFGEIVW